VDIDGTFNTAFEIFVPSRDFLYAIVSRTCSLIVCLKTFSPPSILKTFPRDDISLTRIGNSISAQFAFVDILFDKRQFKNPFDSRGDITLHCRVVVI
jgi:hypothetical protein